MRLSHPFFISPGFQFSTPVDFLKALDGRCSPNEVQSIEHLFSQGLPAITSRLTLAAALGVNPGLIWSFQFKTSRHYRVFKIAKGQGFRNIQAPRVALKLVQKWVATTLGERFSPPEHVFGFIPGRSHIQAALVHLGSEWIFSVDLKDFFQTTPQYLVCAKLLELGYPEEGAQLVAQLACLNGNLAQGAPSSPILSNICFSDFDQKIKEISAALGCKVSRYADDIVFSGANPPPSDLEAKVVAIFEDGPWKLAPQKTEFSQLPERIKVHGLLVDGDKARLTKGYRNKIRAFEHILKKENISTDGRYRLIGHVNYKIHVDSVISEHSRRILPPDVAID